MDKMKKVKKKRKMAKIFDPPPGFEPQIYFFSLFYSKNKDVEVMTKLAKIAERLVNQTGIYHSQRPYYWQTVDSDKTARKRFQGQESINGCKQVRFFFDKGFWI